jgi:hypothetical protein
MCGNITDVKYAEYLREEKRKRRVTKSWIKNELELRTPDAIVNAGDCVRMHRAIMNIEDNEFVPLHNKAEIHLFVRNTERDWIIQSTKYTITNARNNSHHVSSWQ